MELNINTAPAFEYCDNDQSTWRYQRLPDITKDFEDELVRIGGINPHGQPVLRVVKGNEAISDRSYEKGQLKYLCGHTPQDVSGYRYQIDGVWQFATNIDDLPENVFVLPAIERQPLGLLRYVIEKWWSPEELEKARRFRTRYGQGDLHPTLREFPRQGLYEPYFIVENAQGAFRKLDKDVLDFIEMKFKYEMRPEADKERDRERTLEAAKIEKEKRREEIWEAAANLDLRLDPEERERREQFWAAYRLYEQDKAQYENTATFYQYNASTNTVTPTARPDRSQ